MLQSYNIKISQLYTSTVDNGANVLKCNKLLKEKQDEELPLTLLQQAINWKNIMDSTQTNNSNEYENEIAYADEETILSYSDLIDIVNNLSKDQMESNSNDRNFLMQNVRCAAHTLQLIIKDALNKCDDNISSLFDSSRFVVKKLKTPNINILLEKRKLNKAILDCPTRWSSLFLMVLALIFSFYLLQLM